MTYFKSILSMMVLIILFFLSPSNSMNPSSSNAGIPNQEARAIKDMKTCARSLAVNCGTFDIRKLPTADRCVSLAFTLWDRDTFSEVEDVRVREGLIEYYLSFENHIHLATLWGPTDYCTRLFSGNDSIQCNNELKEFRDGPGELVLHINLQNPYDNVLEEIGDELRRAVRYALYYTKITNYINIPNLEIHRIEEQVNNAQITNTQNIYRVLYMIHISSRFGLVDSAIKQPKDFCIEKFGQNISPLLRTYLTSSPSAGNFLLRP